MTHPFPPSVPWSDGIDVLWLTAGLGCDGESIALTAATQPSVEHLRAGALPGVPPLRIHNPVFAYEVGDAFVERFERAAREELDPFILIVEGSIPDETNKTDRYRTTFGTDRVTGQQILTTAWIDRLGWAGSGGARTWAASASAAPCQAFRTRFSPFMDQPPGSLLSSEALMANGKAVRALRRFTQDSLNREPVSRRPRRAAPGTTDGAPVGRQAGR